MAWLAGAAVPPSGASVGAATARFLGCGSRLWCATRASEAPAGWVVAGVGSLGACRLGGDRVGRAGGGSAGTGTVGPGCGRAGLRGGSPCRPWVGRAARERAPAAALGPGGGARVWRWRLPRGGSGLVLGPGRDRRSAAGRRGRGGGAGGIAGPWSRLGATSPGAAGSLLAGRVGRDRGRWTEAAASPPPGRGIGRGRAGRAGRLLGRRGRTSAGGWGARAGPSGCGVPLREVEAAGRIGLGLPPGGRWRALLPRRCGTQLPASSRTPVLLRSNGRGLSGNRPGGNLRVGGHQVPQLHDLERALDHGAAHGGKGRRRGRRSGRAPGPGGP